MKLLGLEEEDEDSYISQIRYDKKGKYDPTLQVKFLFHIINLIATLSDNYSKNEYVKYSKDSLNYNVIFI